MGVTIHYRLARNQMPEYLLKKVEALAKKLGMIIEHRSWNHLEINPHEQSESIELHWHKVKTIKSRDKEKWDYNRATINELGELDNETWFCSSFTKTHYAGVEIHIKVAELLRFIASHCTKSEISDEAGYYEAGMSEKTLEKLKSYWNDYNKSIGLFTAKLKEAFGKGNVITGNEL